MKEDCAVPSNLTVLHQRLFDGVFAKAFEKYLRQVMGHPLGPSTWFSSEECILIQNRKFHPEVMPLLQDGNRTPEFLEKETSFSF